MVPRYASVTLRATGADNNVTEAFPSRHETRAWYDRVMRLLLLALLVGCSGSSSSSTGTLPVESPSLQTSTTATHSVEAPPTAKKPWPGTRTDRVSDVVHGQKISDPYRWLEAEAAPEVQTWMTAQDQFARAELAKLPGRAELMERAKKLYYYDAITAPETAGGRFFYSRKHADKEK